MLFRGDNMSAIAILLSFIITTASIFIIKPVAIHAKLLEIYANRRSTKQFETLAGELYAQSGGNGPEWHKVAEMGRQIDPSNPLYGAAKTSAAVSPGAPVEIALPPEAPVATVEPVAVSAFEVPASESDSVAVEAATVPELPQASPEQAAEQQAPEQHIGHAGIGWGHNDHT